MTKYSSRDAKLRLAKRSFVTLLTRLPDIQTRAEGYYHLVARINSLGD